MRTAKKLTVVTLIVIAGLVGGGAAEIAGAPEVWAFDRAWSAFPCINALRGDRSMVDDVPNGVDSSEAAFIRLNNNDSGDETCAFGTTGLNLSTSTFRFAKVYAAVSDNTKLQVSFASSTSACGASSLTTVTHEQPPGQGSKAMQGINEQLPTGQTIRSICVSVTDHNNASNDKVAALIDKIVVKQSATGAETNIETFTGTGTTIV